MSHNLDNLDDFELILDSPVPATNATKKTPNRTDASSKPRVDEDSREASLKQELESIQKINEVIEGVIDSLEKAKENVNTVKTTVNSASSLLETWTRILSQAEHNQRLILNPAWQGASQDLVDIEHEQSRKVQEAHRRQIEEQLRREAAARKAEEDERRRAAVASRGTRGGRGHNRVGSRTPVGTTSNASKSGTTSGRGVPRAGSSIGRGTATGRTRGTTRGRGA
jgi:hypothetical protein